MAKTYDALIIGAGHNGLVTAAYLAKAGLDVLVLERRPVLGGAGASETIYPGFIFNMGAHDAGLFLPTVVEELVLESYGLEFAESQVAAISPQLNGDALTLWRESERNVDEIGRFSVADAHTYPKFITQLSLIIEVLREILEHTPPELGDLTLGELWPWLEVGYRLRRSGKREMMAFLRILPLPVRDFLDEWFENDSLKGLLAIPALSGGMPGPFAGGTAFMMLYQQLGGINGGYRSCRFVKGGTGQLSLALAEAVQQQGAEIRLNSEVEHVILDDERARGILLNGGEAIGAQMIISSLDPRQTFFRLVGAAHLTPNFMREIRNIRYRGMTAKVNLALDRLPHFRGVTDENQLTGIIAIGPSLEYLERASDHAKYGRISEFPILEVTIPTLLDSTLAPDDQHVMSISMQYAPYHLKNSHWDDEREGLGDHIVSTLAQYSPDLPDSILYRQIITPLDWERDFGLTEGCIFHGRMELDQLLFMRPVAGWANYKTPFENLFLCGAGTHPGGGITGAPGYNAARKILKEWKGKEK